MAVPGDGAAGAGCHDQVGNFSIRLFPYFGTGALVMSEAVGQVVVLIGIKRVGNLFGEAAGYGVIGLRVVRFDIGRADDDLGAQRLQDIHFFFRLFVGRREDAFIPFDDGGEGEAHPSITGSAFDDGATGL